MPPIHEQEILRFPPSAVAARSVNDFRIPDEAIRADADVSKRMDECAMELVRLSLLGIAGYGFLIKEIAAGFTGGLAACKNNAALIVSAAACFAITLCFAFISRELQVRCSAIQIAILRTFGKLENQTGGWSQGEIEILKSSLTSYRAEQKKKLEWNRHCMRGAHVFFAAGAIITVICFAVVLHDL
ncbi:MAG TPA: hypothetical protein VGM43_26520 [Bryobacteraceae bacterium]|jgi:hypothetical protein